MLRPAGIAMLVCMTLVGSAHAQNDAQRKATADALFDDGRKLLAAGQVAPACAKFEASIAALPQLGTRLNLASCYERLGKLASAWAEFRESASLAAKRGDSEREVFARSRVNALDHRLSRLTIKLASGAAISELRVTRDGVVVLPALLDAAVPVDPGPHSVVASAPGFRPWTTEVRMAGENQSLTVEVPALIALPPEELILPGVVADPAEAAQKRRTYRIAALSTGAAGLVAVGVGTYFGLSAKSKWDESKSHCDANIACDQTGVDLVNDARSAGTISTIAFGVGAAALLTGVALYLLAPTARNARQDRAAIEIAPTINNPGLILRHRF